MNKQLIISLGLVVALSTATISAIADTTIYTDGIGRLHFLGKDKSNAGTQYDYTNSAQQDLTRKLYENAETRDVEYDTTYDQHPLKNYENTFPDSRFSSQKIWKTKYSKEALDDNYEAPSNKTTVTATKGQTDYTGQYAYGSTFIDNKNNEVKTSTKKHWWNRK